MKVPNNLKYTKTDEWVLAEGNVATIGITDYAQTQLSDIVYVDISLSVNEHVINSNPCATVESVKAAAEINAPVSGNVIEVNDALSKNPEIINEDPYGKAWMLKIKMEKPDELSELMDAIAYQKYCDSRGH